MVVAFVANTSHFEDVCDSGLHHVDGCCHHVLGAVVEVEAGDHQTFCVVDPQVVGRLVVTLGAVVEVEGGDHQTFSVVIPQVVGCLVVVIGGD